jgi:hypothetical protein
MFEAGSLGKDFVPIILGGFVGGVDPARQVDAVNFKGLLVV